MQTTHWVITVQFFLKEVYFLLQNTRRQDWSGSEILRGTEHHLMKEMFHNTTNSNQGSRTYCIIISILLIRGRAVVWLAVSTMQLQYVF
jgi:hypothetical protein